MSVDVSKHLGLAYLHSIRWLRRGRLARYIEPHDMHQEAVLALYDADKKYDEAKGAFSTFAYHYVEGFLIRQWWRNRRIVMPGGARNNNVEPKNPDRYRAYRHGKDVDIDEVDESELIDDNALDFVELVEGGSADKLLDTLPPRQRDIFERYVLNEETETLKAIGDSYGLSRERIRQLYELTRRQLRERAERAGYER